MDSNKKVLLHLSLISGVGPSVVLKIIKKFFDDFCLEQKNSQIRKSNFDLSKIYNFTINDFKNYFGFSEKVLNNLVKGLLDKSLLEKEISLIEKYKISLFTLLDQDYPEGLKQIHLPPTVIYCKGGELSVFEKSLAVVGSRKSTDYAEQVIGQIVPEIVRNGYTIVSGGALGVDTAAHKTAVDNNGKTVVVLGSGLCNPYPAKNKDFFRKIIKKGGILVSPFPLQAPPEKGNFPARNRVIAGLSYGCLVVQAAKKSGALITAKFALDEGRHVFAVPGSIFNDVSQGCHNLLKQGAKLVNCTKDILEDFGLTDFSIKKDVQEKNIEIETLPEQKTFALEKNPKKEVINKKQDIDPVFEKIINALGASNSIDELSLNTGLNFECLQEKLFDMELEGLVKQNFTGFWEKV